MTKLSLTDQLLKYIRNEGVWINGGTLERMEWRNPKNGTLYKPSNISRRLRELETGIKENGQPLPRGKQLEKKIENGSVWYSATPPKEVIKYYVPALGKEIVKKVY